MFSRGQISYGPFYPSATVSLPTYLLAHRIYHCPQRASTLVNLTSFGTPCFGRPSFTCNWYEWADGEDKRERDRIQVPVTHGPMNLRAYFWSFREFWCSTLCHPKRAYNHPCARDSHGVVAPTYLPANSSASRSNPVLSAALFFSSIQLDLFRYSFTFSSRKPESENTWGSLQITGMSEQIHFTFAFYIATRGIGTMASLIANFVNTDAEIHEVASKLQQEPSQARMLTNCLLREHLHRKPHSGP